MCKIANSECLFKIGFKWSYMSVIVAPGSFSTFMNRLGESKLPSILFNMGSLARQMVPFGHLFGVSLDGRLSSCVTGFKEIGFFQVVFQK